ncbi:nitroreductase family protein [Hathewaya histolytica]|uniref:Nitroreductase n=1 Tax=Hathewaya histolytica TaxID=1498 RepID=A0A4U9RUM3_HATHI|nr:nitroreductase family protein [Hathewaya histolytica]VTQ94703.1 nitroreductase [Hathewaya histolytica]
MEAIFRRRSIRKYKPIKISEDMLENLLRAGMSAPSAVNQKPWHFIVIEDRTKLDEIATTHPYAKMLYEAPLAICVCANMNLGDFKHYWPQDCSAATENILIEAEHLGLGAVWLGVYPVEDLMEGAKKVLNLPDDIVPFCFISIGYPNEEKKHYDRFDKERIHYNNW